MSSIDSQNSRTANRCRVVFNGKVLAEGTSVTANEDGGFQGVYTIGSEEAAEHTATQLRATVTIAALYWKKKNIQSFNLGNGLCQLPTFDIEGLDDSDNSVLFVARTCSLGNRALTIQANQNLSRNVSLMAIRLEDGNGGGKNGVATAEGLAPGVGTTPAVA